MPELPEVETIVRQLDTQLHAQTITRIELFRPQSLHLQSLSPQLLIATTIHSVWRRAKLILLTCKKEEQTYLLFFHLRMTGALLHEKESAPDPYTRISLTLHDAKQTTSYLSFHDIRAFGQVLITDQAHLDQWSFYRTLGPEPLTMDYATFEAILEAHAKCNVKAMLLNQRAIAGIGNIYSDESLFQAHILPTRKVGSLDLQERRALYKSIQTILTQAIAQCGTSFRNYQDAHGHAGAFQNALNVYGRGGLTCNSCGNPLQKATVAGRSTVYCAVCQR